ncbi:hypothetical protein VB776_15780 [Arcicella sp. DC2W]|uniref:Anti-sigma factor n=1 Tax=Arcicella gelida TaxID=2984195 RepID=A0ABU5S7E4_9BACT|nr:hypothetical protein [Arcicella sp. DC2W]MEA5404393.1 hypothetical protein [Arcicella sp. DC2W]
MLEDNYKVFEEYIKGNLDVNQRKIFLKKLQEDDNFYQDYLIWTKLDHWLDEITYFEIEKTIDEITLKEHIKPIIPLFRLKFIELAACLIFVFSFSLIIYKRFYDLNQLQGSFSYQSKLYENSSKPSKEHHKFSTKSLVWEAIKAPQKDTTYQIIYEDNSLSPQKIIFKLPKISVDFNKKAKIYFDDTTDKFVLTIGKRKYFLIKSKKWEKLTAELSN